MFISAIQELSFHRKTGVTLKWRTRFLLCVEQCSKDSILLMCVECIPTLYPYGNSWVVGKALWHIKTRHHQDFHLDDAWFMFSNPVRQMPYISNFRGLLFYDHPSKRLLLFFSIISHRAAIVTQFQNPGAPTIPVNGMRASFFSCKTVPRRTEFYSLSIRRGISIMRSCSSYCGSCGLAIRQPVSKPLLDGAVRAFRVVCCVYNIADFRSAGTSFSRNAVLRERNAESPLSESEKLEVYMSGKALSVEIPADY